MIDRWPENVRNVFCECGVEVMETRRISGIGVIDANSGRGEWNVNVMELVDAGSDQLSTDLSRRGFLRKLGGLAAVAVAGGAALKIRGAGAASTFLKTTSALNLRTGPGPRRRIILVIPNKTVVSYMGESKYGYHKVGYQGTVGWAYADYLVDSDDGETEIPVPVGTARTNDYVNFRSGPSTRSGVIRVLPPNTKVDVFDIWENGFRKAAYAQVNGWIYDDYLGPQSGPLGGYVTTTTALNLREEPNTKSNVLAVMPKGSRAFRGDEIANGFLGVTYNGMFGWAHMDYLVSD
jgi:uncharacterized protein YraI